MAKISLRSGGNKKVRQAKSLSNNNARYSTTNRKGVTTYYRSAKDAPGYNDSFEGKGTTSKGAPLSQRDATGNIITSDSIKPVTTTPVPTVTQGADVGNIVNANNAGLANAELGITSSANGTLTVSNPNAQENDSTGGRLQGIFDSYLKESQKIAPVSSADIYNRQYKEDGIKQKQQEVNNYASQINTITANRDAQVLSLEGSGRGQTTGFIGGEQGRINREAAIQALPVQAQLAASQGNLQLAQDHLNTMVSLKVADATNAYNRQTKLLDTVYQFATTTETRRLDELKAKNERTYQEKQDFLKVQASALSNALGQGAPASIYNAIKSATDKNGVILAAGVYNGDVLGRQLQQQQLANAKSSAYTESLQQKKLLSELNPTDNGNSGDLIAYAQQYAETGKLPGVTELKNSGIDVSQVTAYAKQVPQSNGALVSRATGIKSASLSSSQEDGIAALYDISQKIKDLKSLDLERTQGLVSATFGKVVGSEAQQRYVDLRGEIIDLLARARTGAALTLQEEKFYSDQLPGRVGQVAGFIGVDTQSRLENFDTKINGTLNTKLNTQNVAIYGYSKTNVGGTERTIGEVIDIGGTQYKVLPDGTLTNII